MKFICFRDYDTRKFDSLVPAERGVRAFLIVEAGNLDEVTPVEVRGCDAIEWERA